MVNVMNMSISKMYPMKDAVLATEDNRFYDHGALDYKRLFGAVGKNLTGGFVHKVLQL